MQSLHRELLGNRCTLQGPHTQEALCPPPDPKRLWWPFWGKQLSCATSKRADCSRSEAQGAWFHLRGRDWHSPAGMKAPTLTSAQADALHGLMVHAANALEGCTERSKEERSRQPTRLKPTKQNASRPARSREEGVRSPISTSVSQGGLTPAGHGKGASRGSRRPF